MTARGVSDHLDIFKYPKLSDHPLAGLHKFKNKVIIILELVLAVDKETAGTSLTDHTDTELVIIFEPKHIPIINNVVVKLELVKLLIHKDDSVKILHMKIATITCTPRRGSVNNLVSGKLFGELVIRVTGLFDEKEEKVPHHLDRLVINPVTLMSVNAVHGEVTKGGLDEHVEVVGESKSVQVGPFRFVIV